MTDLNKSYYVTTQEVITFTNDVEIKHLEINVKGKAGRFIRVTDEKGDVLIERIVGYDEVTVEIFDGQ